MAEKVVALNALSGRGGEPPSKDMEARVAKLEAVAESADRRLSNIETDVREIRTNQRSDFLITWAGIIAAALGLAGLLAKGFGWL
jgi:hypothetical protein